MAIMENHGEHGSAGWLDKKQSCCTGRQSENGGIFAWPWPNCPSTPDCPRSGWASDCRIAVLQIKVAAKQFLKTV
jgi:hypothetical protein